MTSLHGAAADKPANEGGVTSSDRRIHIIREIRGSEESYVEKLNLIVTLFWGPLHVNPILDKADMDAIFSNIVELRRINLELLDALREHRSNPGLAFTRLAPFLKFYALYAENFSRAMSTLQDCAQRNSEFAGFKTSQERRPVCQSLKLEGFLIMPVQRIPRYRLLLKDLLRHTDENHADYAMLKTSYDKICEVASHINEYIRQHENFEKMLSIQHSLSGAGDYRILMPGRRFIKDGRLMKLCRKKCKERVLFLFSDHLVYAKPRTRLQGARKEGVAVGSNVFRAALPLVFCSVTSLGHHPRVPNVSPLLLIECQSSSLILFSVDTQTVESWLKALQECIRDLRHSHRNLVEEVSRRSTRSMILTNTMLKGSRQHKNLSGSGSLPLLNGSSSSVPTPSDYPLRCSVMSHEAEDDDEATSGSDHNMARAKTPDTAGVGKEAAGSDLSLPANLATSQDVDDLLKALASIDSMDDDDITNAGAEVAGAGAHIYAQVRTVAAPDDRCHDRDEADTSVGRTRSASQRSVEKFSRNGSMTPHQVTATVDTTTSPRSEQHAGQTGGEVYSPSRHRLAGQGPSFRRRPPNMERYRRHPEADDGDACLIETNMERYRRHPEADDGDACLIETEQDTDDRPAGARSRTIDRMASRTAAGDDEADSGDADDDTRCMSLDRRTPAAMRAHPTSQRSASESSTLSDVQQPATNVYHRGARIAATPDSSLHHTPAEKMVHFRADHSNSVDDITTSHQPTAAARRQPMSVQQGGYFDQHGHQYGLRSSPETLEPEPTGTLRKKRQVKLVKQPLMVVATDTGQLVYSDGHATAGGLGVDDDEAAERGRGDGAADDVQDVYVDTRATAPLVVKGNRSDQSGGAGMTRQAGSRAQSDQAGSRAQSDQAGSRAQSDQAGSRAQSDQAGSRAQSDQAGSRAQSDQASGEKLVAKHPPGEDPVTELGCGGFRTTTYSFETGTAQSRLCAIL